MPSTQPTTVGTEPLSSGAIVGIVLGVFFALYLVSATVVVFVVVRRRRAASRGTGHDEGEVAPLLISLGTIALAFMPIQRFHSYPGDARRFGSSGHDMDGRAEPDYR